MDLSLTFRRTTLTAFLAVAFMPGNLSAGGYSVVPSGAPYKWGNSVTMRFDQGPLGALSNAQADVLATNALQKWSTAQVPTCALTLQQDVVELSQDHAANNGSDADSPTYNDAAPDGISPMIYDQFGFLTDAKMGVGNSQFVIGFAGPRYASGLTLTEGRAVINGKFIDGAGTPSDITQSQMEGVVAHEVGHMLNLDHSQCGTAYSYTGNFTGFPTMYPFVHGDIADLELDDKVWISNLYPTASHASASTKISGTTLNSAGFAIGGVNVVARSATNPRDVISCVSGFLDPASGVFEIPGLSANSQWVLDIEQIDRTFTGGSGVGPFDPPIVMPGPAEFITDPGSESQSDSLVQTTTFVTGAAGTTLPGINVRLNNEPPPTAQIEVDGGGMPESGTPITGLSVGTEHIIAGTINGAESGGLLVGGDDIEDYYEFSPAAGVEISQLTLTPTSAVDLNLWVMVIDSGYQLLTYGFSGGTGAELIYPFVDSSLVGSGATAGKIYIGVSTPASSGTFGYQLSIKTGISDNDALVVAKPASVDPTGGNIALTGRGFKNVGGAPVVTFSDPNIIVNSVSFVNSNQLNVSVTRGAGFVPGGTVDIQVANRAGALNYAGRTYNVTAVPVALSGWSLE